MSGLTIHFQQLETHRCSDAGAAALLWSFPHLPTAEARVSGVRPVLFPNVVQPLEVLQNLSLTGVLWQPAHKHGVVRGLHIGAVHFARDRLDAVVDVHRDDQEDENAHSIGRGDEHADATEH